MRGAVRTEFVRRLEAGQFRQARDAQAWIKKRTRRSLSESGVRKVLRRPGGKLKVPRKSHAKKDPAKAAQFQAALPAKLSAVVGPGPTTLVRLWVLDEHRYGLLPVIGPVWGRRGVRVHAPYATKYQWVYLHEALEVDGAHASELLFTPAIDRDIHALFLQQIADSDPTALHVVIQDQAGFHLPPGDARLPANLRLLPLPPTVRNSTRSSASAVCSKPRSATASIPPCASSRTTSPPPPSAGPPRPRSPASSTPGSPIR